MHLIDNDNILLFNRKISTRWYRPRRWTLVWTAVSIHINTIIYTFIIMFIFVSWELFFRTSRYFYRPFVFRFDYCFIRNFRKFTFTLFGLVVVSLYNHSMLYCTLVDLTISVIVSDRH